MDQVPDPARPGGRERHGHLPIGKSDISYPVGSPLSVKLSKPLNCPNRLLVWAERKEDQGGDTRNRQRGGEQP